MTTAQLTGRIEMDLYPEWQYRQTASDTRNPAGKQGSLDKKGVLFSTDLAGVVADKLDRDDTLGDRIAGYGLCGFTMFYLAAHMVKALIL